jgi:hypothetical protein
VYRQLRLRSRFLAGFIAAVFMASAAALTIASPAHATGVDASCTAGNDVYTFTPGLGLTQRATSFTGSGTNASTCAVAPTGVSSVILTSASGNGPFSCVINTAAMGTLTFKWSDNVTSTVKVSSLALGLTGVSKVVTFGGTVSSGRFDGDTLELIYASTANTLLCPSGELTTVPGVVTTLTFTSV